MEKRNKIVFISFIAKVSEETTNKEIISHIWHVLNYFTKLLVGKNSIKVIDEITKEDIYGK